MLHWTALQYICVYSVVNAIGSSLFAPMWHHFNINLCITYLYCYAYTHEIGFLFTLLFLSHSSRSIPCSLLW